MSWTWIFNYMAKALYGAGLVGMSGSINKQAGGFTFGKNNTVRRRVVPTNPQTALQSLVRGVFTFLTQAWAVLTDEQRQAWEEKRSQSYFFIPDPLTGVARKANSAKSLFVQVNFNGLQAEDLLNSPSVIFSTPPNAVDGDIVNISSVVADDSSNTLTVTYTQTGSSENLYVKSTPPVSAGTMRVTAVRNQLRDGSATLGASPAASSKPASYTGMVGQKVFWQVWGIVIDSGKKRLIASGQSIIVA